MEMNITWLLINKTKYDMDLIKNSLAEHNIQRFNESIYLDVLRKNPALQMCLSAIYIIIFVVGIFGNVLVCFVVGNNKAMQTVTNLFIANLSISDILLCVLGFIFTFFFSLWNYFSLNHKILLLLLIDNSWL